MGFLNTGQCSVVCRCHSCEFAPDEGAIPVSPGLDVETWCLVARLGEDGHFHPDWVHAPFVQGDDVPSPCKRAEKFKEYNKQASAA